MPTEEDVARESSAKMAADAAARKGQAPDPGWFVLRYRILTTQLRNQLANAKLETFHLYKLVTPKSPSQSPRPGGRTERKEVPVLHGYVFVHAPLSQVKEMAMSMNLPIMLNRFYKFEAGTQTMTKKAKTDREAQKYVHITHKAMLPFMKAAELKACDMEFFDPKVIDVQKDDLVEFISGDKKGVRGYLKAGKGRNGGLVIVPLADESTAGEGARGPNPNRASISISFQAHQDELAVIAFAKGNRHAKDCVFDARPAVNEAFELYKTTGEVQAPTREKLISFVRRYGQTLVGTNIQETHHKLVLYRIYVVLGYEQLAREVRASIEERIVPELVRRKEAAEQRGNADAAEKQQELLDDLAATDRALEARFGSR